MISEQGVNTCAKKQEREGWTCGQHSLERIKPIGSSPAVAKTQCETRCWSKAADRSSMVVWLTFYQRHAQTVGVWSRRAGCEMSIFFLSLLHMLDSEWDHNASVTAQIHGLHNQLCLHLSSVCCWNASCLIITTNGGWCEIRGIFYRAPKCQIIKLMSN